MTRTGGLARCERLVVRAGSISLPDHLHKLLLSGRSQSLIYRVELALVARLELAVDVEDQDVIQTIMSAQAHSSR